MCVIGPQELKAITTPLILPKWQTELQGHPDPTFTEFITQGIQHGFRIGFNYSLQNLKPCRKKLTIRCRASLHSGCLSSQWTQQGPPHSHQGPIFPTLVPIKRSPGLRRESGTETRWLNECEQNSQTGIGLLVVRGKWEISGA